jgi:hypothetical protein
MMTQATTIYDFNKNSKASDWTIVNDGVMGGLSYGNFAINQEGNGVFSGTISLENNGGFSSVRYRFAPLATTAKSKVVLRIKGDGKSYQFRIMDNLEHILAIELMNAAQGIDFRRPQKTSPILERFLCEYRKEVPFVKDDIVMYKEIHKTVAFLSRTKFDY